MMYAGYASAILSTFIASSVIVFSKIFATKVNPIVLNTSTWSIALIAYLLVFKEIKLEKYSILSGIFISLFGIFTYASLRLANANIGGLVISLSPSLTLLISWLFLNEKISIKEVASVIVGSSAIAIISFVSSSLGVLLALLAALSLAGYSVTLKLSKLETSKALGAIALGASLSSMLFSLPFLGDFSKVPPILSLYIGLCSNLGGTLLWTEAIKRIGASRTSLSILMFPFFVALLSYAILGERLTLKVMFAYALAFASITLTVLDSVKGGVLTNRPLRSSSS